MTPLIKVIVVVGCFIILYIAYEISATVDKKKEEFKNANKRPKKPKLSEEEKELIDRYYENLD